MTDIIYISFENVIDIEAGEVLMEVRNVWAEELKLWKNATPAYIISTIHTMTLAHR